MICIGLDASSVTFKISAIIAGVGCFMGDGHHSTFSMILGALLINQEIAIPYPYFLTLSFGCINHHFDALDHLSPLLSLVSPSSIETQHDAWYQAIFAP